MIHQRKFLLTCNIRFETMLTIVKVEQQNVVELSVEAEFNENTAQSTAITDEKIQKSLDGRPLFRDLPSGTLEEIASSLLYVHRYAVVDMTVETSNDQLVKLVKLEAEKQNISNVVFQ